MTIFIICHNGLPLYSPPEGAKIMWMSSRPPEGKTDLDVISGYDFFENPEDLHEKLSGSLGAMAIHKYLLEKDSSSKSVTIWQYRKFITKEVVGRRSPNFPGMNLVKSSEILSVDLTDPESIDVDYITAPPIKISGLAHQYMASHNIIDFLRHTALAIELGVIEQKSTLRYMSEPFIVPGGIELGTYPAAWWIEAYGALSKTALAFVSRYQPYAPDDPYQRRAVAFCQERLGSHLLTARLKVNQASGEERRGIGIMHTVTDQAVYRGGRV